MNARSASASRLWSSRCRQRRPLQRLVLGARPYGGLNLRRWAHMLGFRGHFLSKSQRYSMTLRAIRADRRLWRFRADLDQLAADTNDTSQIPPDLGSITVVNDW